MSPRAVAARTFSSLRVRNYRLYFAGQLVSMTGTWMQWIAQGWLVLQLTGSGFAVGAVARLSGTVSERILTALEAGIVVTTTLSARLSRSPKV